ncbi:hypothetical protein ACWC9T_35180, partial [Kitasatospora sp. NPDC001159]
SQGQSIVNLPDSFRYLGAASWLGIPAAIWICAARSPMGPSVAGELPRAEGVVRSRGVLTAHVQGSTKLRAAVDLLIALSPLGLGAFGGRAEEAARLLITAAPACDDRAAEGRSRFLLGTVLLGRARLDEAAEQARLAARACEEAADPAVLRQALNDLGLIAQAQAQHEEAISAFDEAAALARRLGHRSVEVASTANAALSRIRSGQPSDAADTCRRLADPNGTADAAMTAYVHYVLGLADQVLGRLDDAASQMRSCIGCAGTAGDLDRESAAHSRLADILRLLGRVDEAVQEAERALGLATEGGRQRERALAHLVLANAMTARGDHSVARTHEAEAHLLLSRLSALESADAKSLLTALATAGSSPTSDDQAGPVPRDLARQTLHVVRPVAGLRGRRGRRAVPYGSRRPHGERTRHRCQNRRTANRRTDNNRSKHF